MSDFFIMSEDGYKLALISQEILFQHVLLLSVLRLREKAQSVNYVCQVWIFLTSIPGRNYHFYAMDGIDSELNEKEGLAARKSKFL